MSSRTVDATAQLLTDEEATFQQHRSSLLRQAQGKYVLIRHKEVVGIYESELQALEDGTRQFGTPPFLSAKFARSRNLSSSRRPSRQPDECPYYAPDPSFRAHHGGHLGPSQFLLSEREGVVACDGSRSSPRRQRCVEPGYNGSSTTTGRNDRWLQRHWKSAFRN